MQVEADRCMGKICRVSTVVPIPKADSIEAVRIQGWSCVAKKGEFAPGDLCLYFTIGSMFPPEYPRTQFLQGKPLMTKVIRGSLSQGLVGQLEWLSDFGRDPSSAVEGEDITELFGVRKYVPPEETTQYATDGKRQHPFPAFVPKTNEERLQNIPEALTMMSGSQIVVTRKEDGCSATFAVNDGSFLVCSRNFVVDPASQSSLPYLRMVEKYSLESKLLSLGRNLAVQGEIVGPKIGCNRLKLAQLEFRVFNVFDIDGQFYLPHDEVEEMCVVLGIPVVPLLFKGLAEEAAFLQSVDSALAYADELEYSAGSPAEGMVVKPNRQRHVSELGTGFKVISNKYLVKHKV